MIFFYLNIILCKKTSESVSVVIGILSNEDQNELTLVFFEYSLF